MRYKGRADRVLPAPKSGTEALAELRAIASKNKVRPCVFVPGRGIGVAWRGDVPVWVPRFAVSMVAGWVGGLQWALCPVQCER